MTVSGVGAAYMLRLNLKRDPRDEGREMQAQLHNSTNYNDRSDYAVALAYTGRNREAVELLQQLEQEQPGNYFVAANLGTALELAGDNAAALHWIGGGDSPEPGFTSHDRHSFFDSFSSCCRRGPGGLLPRLNHPNGRGIWSGHHARNANARQTITVAL